MFDFFDKILGFIETVFTFFLNLVQSLIQAVVFLGSSSSFVLSLIGFMPTIIGTAITCFFAVYVIKFLIGR